MLFQDRDENQTEYNISLRSCYGHIKNQIQLKKILDNSINAKPENIRIAYQKKSYMTIMRDFGILCTSKRIIKKP
jgi:hypothetical protein